MNVPTRMSLSAAFRARLPTLQRRIKGLLWLLLVLVLTPAHAKAPHLALELTLDPSTGQFQAKADMTFSTGQALDFSMAPQFKLSRVRVDGKPLAIGNLERSRVNPAASHDTSHYRVPGKPRQLRLEYAGKLPALPKGEQGNSANPSALFASLEGSYLAAGAGWYPDPGVPFTYTVKLTLPKGQKALAPGKQTSLRETQGRYVSQFDFPYPAEGLWVMAGPYEVAEQSVRLDNGKQVMVRTWFHPELASLAPGYLQDSARYIQRYSRLIGAYPFDDFSVVSSPLPFGLGMPSLTYLGRDVLRLPFIRATSLGHEVLHNWWGNSVYPEWSSGNWSEGLTTFMADYAFKEDQSEQAAREMRLNWLRDLSAIPASAETALVDFKAREHGISSVIGYGKSAMLFLMLQGEIGRPAFEHGIRLFWQRQRFKTANWNDLQSAFSEASGRNLSGFFRQWTMRTSSAQLDLALIDKPAEKDLFKLAQRGEVFDLLVPIRIQMSSGKALDLKLRLNGKETIVDTQTAPVVPGALQVELDPEFRLWRRLDPLAVPPIFRGVFISQRTDVFLANASAEWAAPAAALAGRLLDAEARQVPEAELFSSADVPALVIGDHDSIAPLLARLGLQAVPDVVMQNAPTQQRTKGSAQAWTARSPSGKTFAFVMADSPAALGALQRSLPHYGRQSWLVIEDSRVIGQGAWPVAPQSLVIKAR
ncbi:MAG: M1 family aminopeptidase [Polaromonas sp.]